MLVPDTADIEDTADIGMIQIAEIPTAVSRD
jgi:hypothetical protein